MTTTTDPHAAQRQRAADWHAWRPFTASACPRVVAGKPCKADTGDRLCLCQRHHHLLDHARMWIDPDGRHILTGEPYSTHDDELRDLFRDLATLRLAASITGRSMWNPGHTLLITITRMITGESRTVDQPGLHHLRGTPSDRKRMCSRCDPTRGTRPHRDKYAHPRPEHAS